MYIPKVDSLLIYDNSTVVSELIAEKEMEGNFIIYNSIKFNKLMMIANE
ncbi:MAG: hypothetical protein K2Q22_10455 [Cytophagales bacterium]|nr:hypothetical protein [Cytophagales bacterium]